MGPRLTERRGPGGPGGGRRERWPAAGTAPLSGESVAVLIGSGSSLNVNPLRLRRALTAADLCSSRGETDPIRGP